ncbi:protein kinase domain-containing protein [Nocardia shimofusensis]|uniref:protein kinase domain-containing protein n=1 Tax=Nocardia shimofusensis TaxID=228596 RepID=UPI00248122B5|nr:protein kinase [Nocardia shimofusensis]
MRAVSVPIAEELSAAGFEDAEEIGRGGFGVVYRCLQPALNRTVAVKVLTAELDEENRARFFREQQAMGRLTGHPNIVTVLQVGATASERPFLVMPYHPWGSLDARIREQGPLPVDTVLRIGVKIAGALESAHRLGIVHRDVKPANILLTDYGEPVLTDFGIARVVGGFQTASGTLTGSPAFTAPEVLEGEDPGPAADVYGLGAGMFCALTGHAAFERRSGENVVAQFSRITTQPVPDLRDSGISADVSAVVAMAMNRDPRERPSASALGEAIRQTQRRQGLPVDEMALSAEPVPEHRNGQPPAQGWRPPPTTVGRAGTGALPLELTSFVDRRTEVAEVKNLLTSSRLVTLTGTGGVGKTRLALRAASNMQRDFVDGVWLIELADVSDPSLLVEVAADALGLRDEPTRPLHEIVLEFLSGRKSLVVVDNCEQVVEAAAGLVEAWLRACPDLRILVTTREPLNIPGEAVLRVSPLTVPDVSRQPSLRGLPKYDAVTLFADRAAAAVPGFELDEDNMDTVARICARLDGLPLAIELAAARMRMMSPEQILDRLTDRYALLTRASRTAPTRQQTLRWCIDWSYELCTPAEQRMWARLSVFAGGFELDAAEQVCGGDTATGSVLDVLSSLVDKSILLPDDTDAVVRFRMLETLRDYGWQKLQASGEAQAVRLRHRDWYQRLALDAEAAWISDQQLDWFARLERELPNLRAALECSLAEDTDEAAETGLRIASALVFFWTFRGVTSEGRRWLDRALAHPRAHSIPDRVKALHAATLMALYLGDAPESVAVLVAEAHTLAERDATPMLEALVAYADGMLAFYRADRAEANSCFTHALELFAADREESWHAATLMMLGWTDALHGDARRAIEYHEQVLDITEARGDWLFRSSALWGIAIAAWRQDDRHRAQQLLEEALRVNQKVNSPLIVASALEAMAWIAEADGAAERAAVMMGAAQALWPYGGSVTHGMPGLEHYHDECDRRTRAAVGRRRFSAASRRGQDMDMDAAVNYALGEQPTGTTPTSGSFVELTKRERQVADLIAQGLTNKQIAAKLVISQRTAQGHVEHILTKLGFTSRVQIAAWVVEGAERHNP